MKIKTFKTFNESFDYDEDFNEYIVKNMLTDDDVKSEIWSLISDLLHELRAEHELDSIADLRDKLQSDNKNRALQIAINTCLMFNNNPSIQKIADKLQELKKLTAPIANNIRLRVKNIIQAEDLKAILQAKPWNCRVKITGHILTVDIKDNTLDEINNLLQHLPFQTEVV